MFVLLAVVIVIIVFVASSHGRTHRCLRCNNIQYFVYRILLINKWVGAPPSYEWAPHVLMLENSHRH